MPELRVQSLVRELRVHVLHCVAKIKKRKKEKKKSSQEPHKVRPEKL